jgi:lipid A ethanolaminephosphotransferase
VSTELLILSSSLFFSILCNQLFWSESLAERSWLDLHTWLFAAGAFAIITSIHCVLLGLLVNRWTAKPLLSVLFITTSMALYYMNTYTVFFDTTMVRNIFNTDVKEAGELITRNMLMYVFLYGVLPSMVIARFSVKRRPWVQAAKARIAFLLGAVAVASLGTVLGYQDYSVLMRNHKEVRYLVTPGNFLVSSLRTGFTDTQNIKVSRIPIGTDARLAASWTQRKKPVLFVLVVGETARAANWGLNGYERQSTPELARSDVINFPQVDSCGTNTEVSVPCLFSPFGRHDYDEKKIRQHQSLLHVLEYAGIKTIWRDNQSGCKGVCDGLEIERLDSKSNPQFCDAGRCLDEILLDGLDAKLKENEGKNLVLVLHQLGNHGPAYSHRYPQAYRQFTPTCENVDLGQCTRQEIINSYDNALLYTDHFLAQTIRQLKTQSTHDAAMIYVSDHGESLGENGIYLHGLPYSIAPTEQTQVPMVMWMSDTFASSFGVDQGCLLNAAKQTINHDYLFHTILGLLDVKTSVYDQSFDFMMTCRLQQS